MKTKLKSNKLQPARGVVIGTGYQPASDAAAAVVVVVVVVVAVAVVAAAELKTVQT